MKRIAIWVHGGIGGGFFSQGQPSIQELVFRLSQHFEIEIYSLLPPNKQFILESAKLFSFNRRVKLNFLRWLYLALVFFRVSIRKPYHLIYGFWGYPSGFIAVVLGKLWRIPSVVHLQGGDAVSIPALRYGVFYHPVRGGLCRWAYMNSSCLIVLTSFQQQMLKVNKVTKSVMVIPFGVDREKFTFKEIRFDQPFIRFLHVANHTPVKGQEVMLKTFALVAQSRPSRLVIIGADFFEGQLEKWCKALGIEGRVDFMGPQPHASIARFYHDADILLHTPYYEGQGLVFAEAASCGTIIAGTCVGMLSDMPPDASINAEPGEPEILAKKILVALQSPGQLRKIQTSARQYAAQLDIRFTERKICDALNQLLHLDHAKDSLEIHATPER
jgi:glycosyltransferase involved in cell wall biosynthesis